MSYVPQSIHEKPALVVVLHGCTQNAGAYDAGSGWSTLAERYGFAVLFPEQQRSNNPNGCFNWFLPEHSQRDGGEPVSIYQMIEKMIAANGVDRSKVFITGLSAGGAMTSIMLACYPEVFAAGAVVAGLPFGAAANVKQAFQAMYQSPPRPAREWGDLVRQSSSHKGPWPRISIWHGSADKTVIPSNAREILKQWTDVHGLPSAPSTTGMVDGFPRDVWFDATANALVEFYTITGMGHGTPLAPGNSEGKCGVPGPYLLSVGISSSFHIARFFGIADPSLIKNAAAKDEAIPPQITEQLLPGQALDETEATPSEFVIPPSLKVADVINRALKAAGLMK